MGRAASRQTCSIFLRPLPTQCPQVGPRVFCLFCQVLCLFSDAPAWSAGLKMMRRDRDLVGRYCDVLTGWREPACACEKRSRWNGGGEASWLSLCGKGGSTKKTQRSRTLPGCFPFLRRTLPLFLPPDWARAFVRACPRVPGGRGQPAARSNHPNTMRRPNVGANAAACRAPLPPSHPLPTRSARARHVSSPPRPVISTRAATLDAPPAPAGAASHAALLHGLGDVGDVPPRLMPILLRLAHVR